MDGILNELIHGEKEKDHLATKLCISSQKLVDLCGQINQIMPVTIISDFNSEYLDILAIQPRCRKILKSFLLSGGFNMMAENLKSQDGFHKKEFMAEFDTSAVSRQKIVTKNMKIISVAILIGSIFLAATIFSFVRFIR